MELIALKNKIIEAFTGTEADLADVLSMVQEDKSIFPFNEYEHLICSFINIGGLTYDDYLNIRLEYISTNPNLWLFEISAPRTFGAGFAQTYVQGKCGKIKKPNKKLDSTYSGQYDLWLDGISIEVKASRAVDSDSSEALYMKALSRDTEKIFLMNFQQLKPQYCDVFIWIAVFRDEIVLWVLNATEVSEHSLYSKGQHRGNIGNEGQIHITHDNIRLLDKYMLQDDNLEAAIKAAKQRY